jgi:hypothetical protein
MAFALQGGRHAPVMLPSCSRPCLRVWRKLA